MTDKAKYDHRPCGKSNFQPNNIARLIQPLPTRLYFYESKVILLFVLLVTFHLILKLGSWAQYLQTDHNGFLCLAMYLVRCVIHAHCFVFCNFCHPRAQMLRDTAGKTIFLQLVIASWGGGAGRNHRWYIFVKIYDNHAMPGRHANQARTWLKHRKNCECCPGHYLSTSVY